MNEDATIMGLRSGDEKAYKYLYDYHYSVLCAFACRYVMDYNVAEMIVSDVIYSIWKNRSNFYIDLTLRGYLLRAVSNGCLNYLKKQTKQISIDLIDERSFTRIEEDGYSLIEQELDIKIQTSIEALPELTRKVFILSRFENLKYEEIAKNLNVSVDVVKYHIKSALSKLRKSLKEFF